MLRSLVGSEMCIRDREETVRTLVETQALDGPRGGYRLTQPVPTLQIPPTVQAVLAARIDRLAAEDKRLLQTASVIGKDVPVVCLLYTSDAADERSSVDLGGRRI